MGSFICQISEVDWLVSRRIGIYGNREGSRNENDELVLFRDMRRGREIVQSIIEDLIGMRKGDNIFFHVLKAQTESRLHGIYRISEEPFYDADTRLWKSDPDLVFPYRFCFEPHPEHTELCRHDGSIPVSEFYRAIENRDIRSIMTLEREVRGHAHAVKTITKEDAEEILRLLYKNFHDGRMKPVNFEPVKPAKETLRTQICGIGRIEFAIKALMAYELGRRNSDVIKYIPACRNESYDILIESFVGQTTRKPLDIMCVSNNEPKAFTIIEAKTHQAEIMDLTQSLKYQELFLLRNTDRGTYNTSICLLAQEFNTELVKYVSLRNLVIPWEEIVLLKYDPIQNGKDATFTAVVSDEEVRLHLPIPHPRIDIKRLMAEISTSPETLYIQIGGEIPPKIKIELKSVVNNIIVLHKHYQTCGEKKLLGSILAYMIDGKCILENFVQFMKRLYEEVASFQGDFMSVEPVVIAEDYDDETEFFIEKYNKLESGARKQPISVFRLSESKS